uniref:Fibrinogen C-terminal domain-containing protein n=1 Tax=Anopheles farauti TaxID=69004 RepID=A0A182QVR3_9DIPT
MEKVLTLLAVAFCNTVTLHSAAESVSPQNSSNGFATELIISKLDVLEYQSFENNLQTEQKITILSSRVDNLVRSMETLSWLVQQASETVTLLGANAKHTGQNLTEVKRDLTTLLAQQKLVLTSHKFGEYLLQRGCDTSNRSLLVDAHRHTHTSCNKSPFPEYGVYGIQLEKSFKQPFTVLCDQQYESGGWTVIQHRFDGSIDFYRKWIEYRNGFGNLEGEFWLGLDRIHQLTASAPHELMVLLEDFDGNKTFARYGLFEIAGEAQKYAVTKIEGYSGTAGDSMYNTRGMKFSTLDADNDNGTQHCAVTYTGAWWYSDCFSSNLNGKYLRGVTKEFATGMVWYTFRQYYYSLKSSKMMIRPTAG